MPVKLTPPTSLTHLPYFVLRYERAIERYELIEPQRVNSYDLGNALQTRAYFERVGMEYLGGRAMDSALAFGASQAIVKENRAFGLDLCQVNIDAGIIKRDQERFDYFDNLTEPQGEDIF